MIIYNIYIGFSIEITPKELRGKGFWLVVYARESLFMGLVRWSDWLVERIQMGDVGSGR